MKREGFIYSKICDKYNIINAIHMASRKKKRRKVVKDILNNIDYYAEKIQEMLINRKYIPSEYHVITIKDGLHGKTRIIHKPKFYPDQIIHWCLINQIRHLLMRGMYKWSCASIEDRGQLYVKRRVEKWIRNDYRNTKWCLKIDIKKYYEHINLNELYNKLKKLIKCKSTLWLIYSIVYSKADGLPIGNYTSQWFANLYLQELDHFIKEALGIKYYVRYMDDLVLFSGNKRKLRTALSKIREFLIMNNTNLSIKNNYQIFPVDKQRLDFAGYVYARDKTFIRKRITKRARLRLLRFKVKNTIEGAKAILSYWGWYKHTDSYILVRDYYYENNTLNKSKRRVSDGDKKMQMHREQHKTRESQYNQARSISL